jgi:hypothetical protein
MECIKDHSKMVNVKEKGSFFIMMVHILKELGVMIWLMEMEKLFFKTEKSMKENSKMINNMDKENIYLNS